MKQAAKKMALAAMAGAGLMLAASAANADLVPSNTVTTANGFDDFTIKFLNNGANTTGTKLLAADLTLTTPGTTTATALSINFSDIDADGAPDADISGATNLAFGSTASGTFMRIGASSSFSVAGATPAHFQTDPGGTGSPTQTVDPAYSNLHSFEVAGLSLTGGAGASTGSGANLLNIVVPHGTPVTVTGNVGGDTGSQQPVSFVLNGVAPSNPIVSLTAAASGNPTGFGANVGTLTVTGGAGSYTLAQLTGLTTASGFAEAHTFVPASDPELYGLDVLVGGTQATPAQIAALVADINASGASVGGLTASATSPSAAFPGNYNLFLSALTPPSGDNFLGFNFANETDVPNATVSAIAVVPEPASASLILGACGLLAARRRKTA